MRCRFSHLKNTLAPVSASMVLEVSTGVRRACGLMRSCAAAMSSNVTMSAPVSQGSGRHVFAPFLQEVAAVLDQEGLAAILDVFFEFLHYGQTEHRVLDADGHEAFSVPRIAEPVARLARKRGARIVVVLRHHGRKAPHAGLGGATGKGAALAAASCAPRCGQVRASSLPQARSGFFAT